jgi:serine/threonine-protein kinase
MNVLRSGGQEQACMTDGRDGERIPSRIYDGPVGLRRASIHPEDLTDDWSLAGCPTVEFEGADRPAIGGIPLLVKLGKGGMGYVYAGIDPETGDEVAVKVMPRVLQEQHKSAVARFLREARLAAELDSPHIVRVMRVEHDEITKAHYLVMECVSGMAASEWVDGLVAAGHDGAPEDQALDVAIATCKGLAVAHAAGVIHRDVKPENILLPAAGDDVNCTAAKLADLGLARPADDDENLTVTATALGTAGYMAPEQLENAKAAKPASDVFSLGASLYALLAGGAPFAAKSSIMAIMNTMKGEYPPLGRKRPDVSAATIALIERCLSKDPTARPVDGAALLEDLEGCRAAL